MFDNGIDKIKQLLSDYFSKTPLGQTIGQATKIVDQYVVDPLASRNDQFRYRENAPQGVTDLNMARKYNPQLFKQYEQGTITGPQMDEILRTGRVQEWAPQQAQPVPQESLAQAYEAPPQEVMGVQEQVPQQPEVIDYTKKIPGSKMHTNDDEVWYWSPAPEVSGVPQKALDFYSNYNYNGNGQFETPLDPEYLQLVWNEINQQLPGESENNKIALLETMLSIAHAESHAGRDAGYLDRNSNVWNTGFNARDTSVLKYDPVDPRESADRAVSSVINDFGVLNNKGLTDQTIHNYHIGPNAKYNQAGVDTYRDYLGGWESLYQPTYPWE